MPQPAGEAATPGLYLIVPPLASDNVANLALVPVFVEKHGITSVLLTGTYAPDLIEAVAPHVLAIRRAGAACLVEDDPALAVASGADGVHVSAGPDLVDRVAKTAAAATADGVDRFVGAHGGRERHTALEVPQSGAQYVAFDWDARWGTVASPNVPEDDAKDAQVEDETLVAWWAAVTQVPVVAWGVTTREGVVAARSDAADFIALDVGPHLDAQSLSRLELILAE